MEQFTNQPGDRRSVRQQAISLPPSAHGDFAEGLRTMPKSDVKPDYARGQETQLSVIEGPDFARGERTLPPAPEGPDYARGLRHTGQ